MTRSATRFLHSNPYPNTAAPGQTQECEAGNENYKARPSRSSATSPGNQGIAVDKTASGRDVK